MQGQSEMELSLRYETSEGELSCYAIYQLKDEIIAVWKFNAIAGTQTSCKIFSIPLPEAVAQAHAVKHYFIGIDNNYFRPWAPKIDGTLMHFVSIREVGHIEGIQQAKQIYPDTLLDTTVTQPKPPMNVFPREPAGTNYFSGCLFAAAVITTAATVSTGFYFSK